MHTRAFFVRIGLALLVAVALLVTVGQPVARAALATPEDAPRVVLPGGGGILELASGDGGWVGEAQVVNASPRSRLVRLTVRAAEDDEAAQRVSARFVDSDATTRELAAGSAAAVRVAWMPTRAGRAREVRVHVTASAEGTERSFGVHAVARPGPRLLAAHALSLAILLPLLAGVLALALHLVGAKDERPLARVVTFATALQALVAAYACSVFDGALGRADGNDGFQLVERVPYLRQLGVELHFGVDGVSLPLLVVVTLVGFAGAASDVARPGGGMRPKAAVASYLVTLAAITGALVALDAIVQVACIEVAVLTASLLVASGPGPDAGRAGARLAAAGLVAGSLVLVAYLAFHAASGPTLLADGTPVAHAFGLPELARARPPAGATLFGLPFAHVAGALAVTGFAILLAPPPLHGWLVAVADEAPAPVAALVTAGLPAVGAVGLLRVAAIAPDVFRDGARWLVALGVIGLVHASFVALGERDLRRLAAHASAAHGALWLAGAASLSAGSLEGCNLHAVVRAAAVAALVLAVDVLARRTGERSVASITGLGAEAPRVAIALGVALVASAAAPAGAGFWGALAALSGVFGVSRALAAVAALGLAALVAAHLRPLARMLSGTLDERLRKHVRLAAHGGRVPELRVREAAALAPLLALVLALGLWPAPLLALTVGTVADLLAGAQ